MTGTRIGRSLTICAVVLALAGFATPAFAQAQVKGRVVDAQNKPVEGARVTMQQNGCQNRKYEVKTNRNGEYIQIGVTSCPGGGYTVQAEKDKLSQNFTIQVGAGDAKEVNFVLKPGGAGGAMTKEEAEKRVEGIKAKFAQAAGLGNEGKFDEAIALYNEVIADVPQCQECYLNIGAINTRKKDWPAAEAAYKKAIEVKPDAPEPYNGLANVYNAQQKFKEASEMSAEAGKRVAAVPGGGGGASANILYNQGAIAWNANDFAKAREHFEAAIKADPNHAESHFMLGKVLINLGKLPEAVTEFETYLKIAPTGPSAKEAQSMFDQLKSFRK
jgi:tetratricopeptide (TPR) repeat protein